MSDDKQMELGEVVSDPANYRKMSEPFDNPTEANEALRAFYEGVEELRGKHRMADVLVVVKTNCKYGEDEGSAFSSLHLGDQMQGEILAAYALGSKQSEKREMVAKILAQANKSRK